MTQKTKLINLKILNHPLNMNRVCIKHVVNYRNSEKHIDDYVSGCINFINTLNYQTFWISTMKIKTVIVIQSYSCEYAGTFKLRS